MHSNVCKKEQKRWIQHAIESGGSYICIRKMLFLFVFFLFLIAKRLSKLK